MARSPRWFRIWETDYQIPDEEKVSVLEVNGRMHSWLEDDYDTPTYFVDGACKNNGLENAKAACAYFSGRSCYNSWEDPATTPTNNTAELGAILGALGKARKQKENHIKILTDSQYAVNAINGNWRKRNGEEVANLQLLKRIQRKMRGMRVDILHISREKNQIADRLAKEKLSQL